jgi:hypothetical protein
VANLGVGTQRKLQPVLISFCILFSLSFSLTNMYLSFRFSVLSSIFVLVFSFSKSFSFFFFKSFKSLVYGIHSQTHRSVNNN